MGLTFDKLPVNTLVAADWQTFKALTDGQHIGDHYKGKFRLTKAVCRLLSTLVPIENRAYNKIAGQPLQEDPLFILGHWRSGLPLCTTCLPATSISATQPHIRPYSRTSCCGDSHSSKKTWRC